VVADAHEDIHENIHENYPVQCHDLPIRQSQQQQVRQDQLRQRRHLLLLLLLLLPGLQAQQVLKDMVSLLQRRLLLHDLPQRQHQRQLLLRQVLLPH
jgi:hypothetical protein